MAWILILIPRRAEGWMCWMDVLYTLDIRHECQTVLFFEIANLGCLSGHKLKRLMFASIKCQFRSDNKKPSQNMFSIPNIYTASNSSKDQLQKRRKSKLRSDRNNFQGQPENHYSTRSRQQAKKRIPKELTFFSNWKPSLLPWQQLPRLCYPLCPPTPTTKERYQHEAQDSMRFRILHQRTPSPPNPPKAPYQRPPW